METKPLPHLEGYQVTNDGRVYSTNRKGRPRWLQGYDTGDAVHYTLIDKKVYNAGALVLMAWVSEKPEGMECCHNDGNYKNNHVNNLRWDTRKNNIDDAVIMHQTHSCLRKGEKANRAKLSDHDVEIIKQMKKYTAARVLAKEYNVDISTIYLIWRGENGPRKYRNGGK